MRSAEGSVKIFGFAVRTYKFVDKKSLAFFWDVMSLRSISAKVQSNRTTTHVGADTPITLPSFSFQSFGGASPSQILV